MTMDSDRLARAEAIGDLRGDPRGRTSHTATNSTWPSAGFKKQDGRDRSQGAVLQSPRSKHRELPGAAAVSGGHASHGIEGTASRRRLSPTMAFGRSTSADERGRTDGG